MTTTVPAALVAFYLLSPLGASFGDWTDAYDAQFRGAAMRYMAPERHLYWPTLKAQAACESSLRADAVSPVGAKGLAQFMGPTWDEVRERAGWDESASPFDTEYATAAQAMYVEHLAEDFWTSPRPVDLEFENVWCAYNAGGGNCAKAQRLSGGERDFADFAPYLAQVTGKHATETLGYVGCIRTRWEEVTGLPWPPPGLSG